MNGKLGQKDFQQCGTKRQEQFYENSNCGVVGLTKMVKKQLEIQFEKI